MSNAKYNVFDCIISAPFDNKYKYTCEQMTFPGWKIIDKNDEEEQYKTKIYNFMKLIKNKEVNYKKIKSIQSMKDLKQHFTEARLVQLLEKRGIGRPSTFSSLVSKIQERNYVKKENIQGKEVKCTDFELVDETLEEIETKRTFGNEKNKLVLQELGKIVVEFLIKYYNNLFNYEYTSTMEKELDLVSQGKKIWHTICDTCYKDIVSIKIDKKKNSSKYKIDEYHSYIIGKYGPCIKYEKDGVTKFKQIKKGITLEQIKSGNYSLEDILDNNTNQENSLGVFEDETIVVKTGRYGAYTTFKGKSYSLKSLKKITLENVIPILKGEKSTNPNILKPLNKNISIRKGKYGPYIYYKTSSMSQPQFLGLKGCKLDIEVSSKEDYLEWIKENHNIE